jgi:divalent metal cation (Fe/Co/Zn/Cd) transporter
MTRIPRSAGVLALLTAGASLVLGGALLVQGVSSDEPLVWGLAFPWAGPAAGLVLAVGIFIEGRTLAKATTVSLVGCGGCGSCGCG